MTSLIVPAATIAADVPPEDLIDSQVLPAPPAPVAASPAAVAKRAPRKRAAPVPDGGEVRSVFEDLKRKVYKFEYRVELHVGRYVGGTPTDRRIAEGWIRTKMGAKTEDLINAEVDKAMRERGVSADDVAAEVARNRTLSGFKRDFTSEIARQVQERACVAPGVVVLAADGITKERRVFEPDEARKTFGECFAEGRHVKAMLKEAAMIAVGAGRIAPRGWGTTNKGMLNFLVEHMFVEEETILLGVTDPDEVNQSFVHTWRGSGIKQEEIIRDAVVNFTIKCDYDFAGKHPDFWGHLMVTGEENGLGASRSQGYGRFKTTRFERVK